jgi:peptide/nickel transport system substrate-binding protein
LKRVLAVLLALSAAQPAWPQVKSPDTYTYLTIFDGDSLDPAWSYDTASQMVILNVYDTLVAFDGASLGKLVPRVAEKVPSRANGLISADGKVYTFPIRKGLKFHDGTPVTPEDVRYSIIRFLLFDRSAGPSPLLLQPLLGYESTREKDKPKPHAFKDAEKAVKVKGDSVVLTLPKPFAPLLTILASWAPTVSKAWAAKNGGWDGTEETWIKHNNPQKQSTPFYEKTNGSGPYKLARWDRKTKEFILERNDAYWRGPAKLKRVVIRGVPEFGTRKLQLQAGDADSIYAQEPEHNQLAGMPGVKLLEDLPMVEMNPVAYFTFKINAVGNPFIGSGKLDGRGVPADFFSDVDVRKGFAYAFDYQGFLKDVKRGRGSQATGCIPASLPGHNPKQAKYTLDLKKAEEHLRKAWGGQLWEKGFAFTLTHNQGNAERATLCQILKRNIEKLNPKFRIDVRPVEWPAFLDAYKASKLPIFIIGWQADFPDAHNFAFTMMHSMGDYPATQHYSNPKADELVNAAIAEIDPEKRRKLYVKLQEIEYDDVPHLVIVDSVRYRVQRDWVKGYIHNPIFPDAPWGSYFHSLSKGPGG